MTEAQIVAAARAAFETWYPNDKLRSADERWEHLPFDVKWKWIESIVKAMKAAGYD